MKYHGNADTSSNTPTTIVNGIIRILKKTNSFATTNCSDIKMIPDQLLWENETGKSLPHSPEPHEWSVPENLSTDSVSDEWSSPDQIPNLDES